MGQAFSQPPEVSASAHLSETRRWWADIEWLAGVDPRDADVVDDEDVDANEGGSTWRSVPANCAASQPPIATHLQDRRRGGTVASYRRSIIMGTGR
jgi:hypothetical protein